MSWLGLSVREVYRVSGRAGRTLDGSVPILVILVGMLVLGRSLPTWSILLAGVRALSTQSFFSVLPLDVLPFVPEQTPEHYGARLVYAVARVPLLWLVAPRAVKPT